MCKIFLRSWYFFVGVIGVCLNYLFAIICHIVGCLIMNEWVALNTGTPGTTLSRTKSHHRLTATAFLPDLV